MRHAVEQLAPGSFAIVMAGGIDSVGLKVEDVELLSVGLCVVAIGAYLVLVALTVFRLVAYRSAMSRDLRDPGRGFEFFTFVAGTHVLGVRVDMDGHYLVTAVCLSQARWPERSGRGK